MKTSTDVLAAVKYMFAARISYDPVVRQLFRDMFFKKSIILTTTLTPRGAKEVIENHPFMDPTRMKEEKYPFMDPARMKEEKVTISELCKLKESIDVSDLYDDAFLGLNFAEENKVVNMELTFKDDNGELFLEEMKKLYIRVSFNVVIRTACKP